MQELKVKIETHKRENRHLVLLIDQQKDDTARLTIRLSGTEKQRDDALEALVLQQEIAEELERERKRNKKELAALQHTNKNIIRQREEAQRVVVHLRSLISGQTHHMEHIVRSLTQAPELSNYLEDGMENQPDSRLDSRSATPSGSAIESLSLSSRRSIASLRHTTSRRVRRSFSPVGSLDGKATEGEKVTPEMERSFFNSPKNNQRLSDVSMVDVADRHLRDKTDAITNIIRNISDQCAAAVEGLQLAHNAEQEDELMPEIEKHGSQLGSASEDEEQSVRTEGSEVASEGGYMASEAGYDESGYLSPTHSKHSSVPPTPELEHTRSSTSMSMNSLSTGADRSSQHYAQGLTPKILEDDNESEKRSEAGNSETGMMQKSPAMYGNIMRPISRGAVA